MPNPKWNILTKSFKTEDLKGSKHAAREATTTQGCKNHWRNGEKSNLHCTEHDPRVFMKSDETRPTPLTTFRANQWLWFARRGARNRCIWFDHTRAHKMAEVVMMLGRVEAALGKKGACINHRLGSIGSIWNGIIDDDACVGCGGQWLCCVVLPMEHLSVKLRSTWNHQMAGVTLFALLFITWFIKLSIATCVLGVRWTII